MQVWQRFLAPSHIIDTIFRAWFIPSPAAIIINSGHFTDSCWARVKFHVITVKCQQYKYTFSMQQNWIWFQVWFRKTIHLQHGESSLPPYLLVHKNIEIHQLMHHLGRWKLLLLYVIISWREVSHLPTFLLDEIQFLRNSNIASVTLFTQS